MRTVRLSIALCYCAATLNLVDAVEDTERSEQSPARYRETQEIPSLCAG